ncbi:MAG: PQQ-binding-like beta-propeller repeat protein, partial [Caulobacter sp.]
MRGSTLTGRLLLRVLLACIGLAGVGWSPAAAQVPYERIRKAESEPQNWLTYSGTYGGSRYSRLDGITRENVSRLRPAWVYQTKGEGFFETTPIVVDGVMYVSEPGAAVTALDAATGRIFWTWSITLPKDVRTASAPGPVNRGVAVLDDLVFVGTAHAHLYALDARSGAVRWDVVVGDNARGEFITAAPLAVNGKIIVGISGGDAGIRGFIDAYDAQTGRRVWRTYTVPAPGEPGSETWPAGDAWKVGAGATWVTGSYDPDLNLLYWGTGNPGPDFNGDARLGDNLYTASLLALDAETGAIKWHFQFSPHDLYDWDANHIPVLAEVPINGRKRKVVAVANRNGFYYVLDRATGEFLLGKPFARQTWAKGLDAKGRPIKLPGIAPT